MSKRDSSLIKKTIGAPDGREAGFDQSFHATNRAYHRRALATAEVYVHLLEKPDEVGSGSRPGGLPPAWNHGRAGRRLDNRRRAEAPCRRLETFIR